MASSADRVTMRTIATETGVHLSTVSRALSDSSDARQAVGADVVERVRETAARLGYRRNSLAAGMRAQQSRAIGVLVPTMSDVVLASIFEAIDQRVTSDGYQAIVANTQDDPRERHRRIELLLDRRIDGLIICDARTDARGRGKGLVPDATSVPVVAVNRRATGVASATCDDREGGRLVGAHLIEMEHYHVAVIGGTPWASTAAHRLEGFADACRRHDLPLPPESIVLSGFDMRSGRAAAEKVLSESPAPTAIFALNDYAAIGAMGAARDMGLRIPDDLAIAGFNDIDLAAELPVPLTSVDSGAAEMGTVGADLLLRAIRGHDVASVQTSPALHIRQSTSLTA